MQWSVSNIGVWLWLMWALLACGQASADTGVIDLRGETWRVAQVNTLDGEWWFYPDQWLRPAESGVQGVSGVPFQVPGLWNRAPHNRSKFGYGTFRTRVLLPDDLAHVFLAVPDIPSAYELWINGRKVAANGRIGQSASEEVPGFLPRLLHVDVPESQMDIVLLTSNYHHKEGGIWHSFRVSDSDGAFLLREQRLLFTSFLVAVLLAMSIYHLSIFCMRRVEKAALFFALFCLVVAVRAMLVGERILYQFFDLNWFAAQRIEHILLYLALPFFFAFYQALFPGQVSRRALQGSYSLAAVLSLLTLVLPSPLFTALAFPFQIGLLLALSYVLYTLVSVWRSGLDGARLFCLSFVVMALTVTHDILRAHFFVQSFPLVHFGMMAFVIFQGLALNRRYVNSLTLVEKMSAELQTRYDDLARVDTFKDEFLATTSHELRMPLHGIAGLANQLLTSPPAGMSQENLRQLQVIESTSRRLSTLVNDILDFSAFKHGGIQLKSETVNLRSVANLVVETIAPLLEGKDVVLSADLQASALYAHGDENRIQQILMNLVGNAAKFTDEGFILINVKPADHQPQMIQVDIMDSGMGIDPAQKDTLFLPFQGELQESTLQGSGLGLSITRQLVELHGGELMIDSIPGEGTTVSFTLPMAQARPKGASEPDAASEVLSVDAGGASVCMESAANVADVSVMPGSLIYVVDDEEINRQLVKSQLVREGYRVEAFSGGASLLDALHEQRPDLILLDLVMPNMTGFETCSRLREMYDAYQLPVIMLTARHQVSDVVTALSLGVNDYLTKPYHEKELLARVASQLGVRKAWLSDKENRRLQDEIERRQLLEDKLYTANTRLMRVLDSSTDAVFLLNEGLRIVYLNQAASGLPVACDVGGSIGDLLADISVLESVLETAENHEVELSLAGGSKAWAQLQPLKEGEQYYLALALSIPRAYDVSDASSQDIQTQATHLLGQLGDELNQSRQRMQALEDALKTLAPLLQAEPLPAPASSTADVDDSGKRPDGRQALVELLKQSLSLWERSTGKTKVELAEESRCWRVYVDGSTVKTRTLDKYLSLKTLPEKPRWRSVTRTANFVLNHCELPETDREHLIKAIYELEQLEL